MGRAIVSLNTLFGIVLLLVAIISDCQWMLDAALFIIVIGAAFMVFWWIIDVRG